MTVPCATCEGKTRVVDVRMVRISLGQVVWRRRACLNTNHPHFTTYEVTESAAHRGNDAIEALRRIRTALAEVDEEQRKQARTR
jgi:hypothetical protein